MRSGPARSTGRWSLLPPVEEDATVRTVATAELLLDRYGIVTRGSVAAEEVPGGFAAVYRVLGTAEENGRVRRGYFVEGLGGAQFALTGAVDRLRDHRDPAEREQDVRVVALAATDPAQPYGAALPWPDSAGRPARQAGVHVVLVDGELVAFLERGEHSLSTFATTADHPEWAELLKGLVRRGRYRSLEIRKVDGEPVRETPAREVLEAAGFKDGYKGLVFRSS